MANLIYEGQLKKKGKINTKWKNRWCILSQINGEIFLQYYDSKIGNTLCGTIQLHKVFDIKVVHRDDYSLSFLGSIPNNIKLTNKTKSKEKFSFVLYTAKRKWIFAAFDPLNFSKWLEIFHKYVYGGIIKQGWLMKKGENNKGWKKRYFVLTNGKQLVYYQDETKKNWAGNVPLNGITKVQSSHLIKDKDKKYVFNLITNTRIWFISSDKADDRRQWIAAINKWRINRIQHPTLALIDNTDDIKNTDDPNPLNAIADADDNVFSGTNNNNVVSWECSSCHQTYASKWTVCPGCLRRDTHISSVSFPQEGSLK